MPRSDAPSPADQALIDHAAAAGHVVTAKQLETWRRRGLLPGNATRSLGRGRGSTSVPGDGAFDLVGWLAANARRGARPNDLALTAFSDGLPVPEDAVRRAWHNAVNELELDGELAADVVALDDPDDQAEAIVRRVPRTGALVPATVRRIDKRIAALGPGASGWSSPDIDRLDRGSAALEPMTTADVLVAAVSVIRQGRGAIWDELIGEVARAFGPTGAASPIASFVEHLREDPDAVSIQDVDGIYPNDDYRVHLRRVIDGSPLDLLRLAWQTETDVRAWAVRLAADVEAELDAGTPGTAVQTWMQTSLGTARFMLVNALRPGARSPAQRARSAVALLALRGMLERLQQLWPDAHWEIMDLPVVAPEPVRAFLKPEPFPEA